jgi:AcrR family transcriptional regulator
VTVVGLRERKKRRTRATIVEVAARLFAARGYEATTVAQIAREAEIAESTLFKYFPSKVDVVFSLTDAVTESAKERLLGRAESESASEALVAWIAADLPRVEAPYVELLRNYQAVVAGDAELRREARLRLALLEDVFATAFARDLGEPPESLRVRVLAAIALRGMTDAWRSWYEHHATDREVDLRDACAVKAAHVERVLEEGAAAIELLVSARELDDGGVVTGEAALLP